MWPSLDLLSISTFSSLFLWRLNFQLLVFFVGFRVATEQLGEKEMVSSDVEMGMGDCCVGTIVWVRRRNGSWWPGKILGPHELSASHLMSPRSGTPVKLLGREDASVDWYNLEKSKRVKPFRCGEFDDCIERAEASQGMPPKKREKYARREDAILHALELEKQVLEKKYGKSSISSNANANGMNTKKLRGLAKDTTSEDAKYADISVEDKREGQAQSSKVFLDDRSSTVRPRMRGLQDIGLGPVPSNYTLPASNGWHASDVAAEVPMNGSHMVLEKRKRSEESHHIHMGEESIAKRPDKHRALVQVLETSSAKSRSPPLLKSEDNGPPLIPEQFIVSEPLSVKVIGNDGDESFDYNPTLPDRVEIPTPKSETGLSEEENTTEDTETDSSGTESLASDTYDATTTLSDEGEDIELIPKSFGRHEARESMSDESSGEMSARVSKWQLKGKRNSRSLMKKKPYPYPYDAAGENSRWLNLRGEDEKTSRGGGLGLEESSVNWEDESCSFKGYPYSYWEESGSGSGRGRMKSLLMDVEVQVQSGYQREHVPMISLMSKLNDKAIVGHPIPVETLENGSTEMILFDDDEDEELQTETLQPWRTARRTVKCRMPRLSTLEEEQEHEQEQEQEKESDEDDERPNAGASKGRKIMKRRSTEKIRRLSSIGGMNDLKGGHGYGYERQGGMKMKPAAVACIPVKLVFIRLREELVAHTRHQ